MKKALILGVSGQDGTLLARHLLSRNYSVTGVDVIEPYKDPGLGEKLDFVRSDSMADESLDIIRKQKPAEIYNFSGMTSPSESWEKPLLTLDMNSRAVAALLEVIVSESPESRFFQASSSEMFDHCSKGDCCEASRMLPRTPYSASKLFSHNLVRLIRENSGCFMCSGILFNHESEFRGEKFVTRKITRAAARIKLGKEKSLELGDIDSKRDWGYAGDYVRAMHMMLESEKPRDYVIGTGILHSVRDVLDIAFDEVGLEWPKVVSFKDELKRDYEVEVIKADAALIEKELGWKPEVSFDDMIRKMVRYDLELEK